MAADNLRLGAWRLRQRGPQAARDAMERDPSMVAGLQQGQLYPFAVFLERS